MKFTLFHRILAVGFVVIASFGMSAQTRSAETTAPAAFLFAYWPKAGQESLFDEGYRRHLAWHRSKRDPLTWYAWYVTTGERTGMFIDGTFGISFAAFDKRIEPKADAADFAQNVAPFATPAWRAVYRARPDLSTAQPLETRMPAALAEVTHVVVEPGAERGFEKMLEAVRTELLSVKPSVVLTCYQLIAGGEQPSYLLMVSRSGWADYDTASPLPDLLVRNARESAGVKAMRRLSTETWNYRSDLSYLPE